MGFFKKNDRYQLSGVLCLRVLGLNKENLKMVFHTGSNPVLTTLLKLVYEQSWVCDALIRKEVK